MQKEKGNFYQSYEDPLFSPTLAHMASKLGILQVEYSTKWSLSLWCCTLLIKQDILKVWARIKFQSPRSPWGWAVIQRVCQLSWPGVIIREKKKSIMPKEESQIFKIGLYYFLLRSSWSLPRKQLREDEPFLGRTHSVVNSPLELSLQKIGRYSQNLF